MKMKLLLLTLIGLAYSCQNEELDIIPTTNLNTAFQTNPPIADNILISKVSDDERGNIKLKAVFTPEESRKIDQDSAIFVIEIDDRRIGFRDDGISPDEKKGDGIFTTVIQQNEDEIQSLLRRANQNLEQAGENTFEWFKLRKAIAPQRDLTPFDIDRFKSGQEISIAKIGKFIAPRSSNSILYENSLVVTDIDVIEDPDRTIPDPCNASPGDEDKAWTFAKLMTEMANTPLTGVDPVDFIRNWLETWLDDGKSPNNENIPARELIQDIIDTWDGNDGAVDNSFELRFVPFKLVAIVNRIDLRTNFGYGGGDAGEGRFVFCPVTADCTPEQDFTIIFEYGVNIQGCSNVRAYAQQWSNLSTLTLGSDAYNAALQAITDQFTAANTNPSKPNGSSINQIRTNEISLGPGWELLEFNICDPADPVMSGCVASNLVNTTVKMEPQLRFNEDQLGNTEALSQIFADWLNGLAPSSVLNNNYDVPVVEPVSGEEFLGARSVPNFSINYNWDALDAAFSPMITNDLVRQQFGFNTCGECHTRGAHLPGSPMPFQHIRPGPTIIGNVVQLSAFMLSTTASPLVVPDPVSRAPNNILAERSHRESHLQDLVNSTCLGFSGITAILEFQPLNMVH